MLITRRFQAMLAIARGPFLLLTPAVLFPAAAVSFQLTGDLPLDLLFLIVVGALAAHVAVNALNEYQDFKSGLDNITCRTPFSGGSGTLPDRPALLGTALWLFIGAFLLMVLIGFYLAWRVGPGILSLGLLGGLIIVAYTRLINRMPVIAQSAPGYRCRSGSGPTSFSGVAGGGGQCSYLPVVAVGRIRFCGDRRGA